MNKLGTMKKCPKCGEVRFDVKYLSKNLDRMRGRRVKEEYMQITCTECGFVEKEVPLDSKDV